MAVAFTGNTTLRPSCHLSPQDIVANYLRTKKPTIRPLPREINLEIKVEIAGFIAPPSRPPFRYHLRNSLVSNFAALVSVWSCVQDTVLLVVVSTTILGLLISEFDPVPQHHKGPDTTWTSHLRT